VPGGEMFTILRKRRQFPENLARLYAAQMVSIVFMISKTQKNNVYSPQKKKNIFAKHCNKSILKM
jgi:hypothetical protein